MPKSTFFPVLVLIILTTNSEVKSDTEFRITLSVRDLPNFDIFDGPPDPYAVVYYASIPGDELSKVGETAYFDNVNEADWPEEFSFDYTGPGSAQRVRVEIMDSDVDADDYIGFVEFDLSEVIGSFGMFLKAQISPEGYGEVGIKGVYAKLGSNNTVRNNAAGQLHQKFK